MKKKLTAIALVICLMAVAIVGGSLAYFTDDDKATNTFTVGNVDITLNEVFEQNSKLLPGIDVKKEVTVTNSGSEDAYVRVHIAFPSILDSGSDDQPQYAAYNNTLHWNMSKASMVNGLWGWGKNADADNYPGNGGPWNAYETEINGVKYTVYVATYETALKAGETTADKAIHKVYLDTKVTNDMITEIKSVLVDGINVYVFAEGGQAAGFEDAYDALDTQFGVPGEYPVDFVPAT